MTITINKYFGKLTESVKHISVENVFNYDGTNALDNPVTLKTGVKCLERMHHLGNVNLTHVLWFSSRYIAQICTVYNGQHMLATCNEV